MDIKIGKLKGQAWRDSGKLESRPDPITGPYEHIQWVMHIM